MQLNDIQQAILAGQTRVGSHAIREAAADGLRMIDIWNSLLDQTAEIIEDYPQDPRGPSCLIYCEVQGAPEHVVVAYPSLSAAMQMGYPSLVFMVTCYRPGGVKYAAKWSADFKRRIP